MLVRTSLAVCFTGGSPKASAVVLVGHSFLFERSEIVHDGYPLDLTGRFRFSNADGDLHQPVRNGLHLWLRILVTGSYEYGAAPQHIADLGNDDSIS
jgi:hypothetical protein